MSDLAWLDEIERRAEAATPGPWRPVYEDAFNPAEDDDVDKRDAYWVAGPDYVERTYDGYSFWNKADAEFVAAAREDIPSLCRAVRELAEALEMTLDAADAVIATYMRGQIPAETRFRQLRAAADRASKALERWRRGGDRVPERSESR